MELTQLIQRAQGALDRGEHHVVAAACRHALATYPTCLGAHRLLGEASLEQGQTAEAIEEFGFTLALDPLDVVSSLGLGVASEEQGDVQSAYAYYLNAWELNPSLDQLRDELVRLRQALGGEERLHRTRAGLAGVFARSGQLGRAVAEWRAVLTADPESFRARTALLEALWRHGEDAAALALAREILTRDPETVRALAILADVEHRRGLPEATGTAAKYRALDPAGEVLAHLREGKPQANLTWLMPEPAMVPPFDFVAVGAPANVPAVLPARTIEAPVPAVALAAATLAATEPNQQVAAPDLWDTLVRDISGDGTGGEIGELAPFAWPTEGDGGQVFGLDADPDAALPFDAASFDVGNEFDDPLAALAAAPIAAEPPPPAPTASPAGPEQFITADGRVDLTVGWDDLDRTLLEATPTGEAGEFDHLLAEFGVDGIAPFDPLGEEVDEEWEPFSEQDFAEWPQDEVEPRQSYAAAESAVAADDLMWPDDLAAAPPPVEVAAVAEPAPVVEPPFAAMDAVAALTVGWDAIEEELAAAVPVTGSPDDEAFDSLTDEGIVPFDFESAADVIDPLANPDAVGAPLDFDDLLMVTSQDGTAPLGGGPAGVPDLADRLDAVPATAGSDPLAGLEPFAFDDLGQAGATDEAIDFSDVDDARPVFGTPVEGFDLFDEAEPPFLAGEEPLQMPVAVAAAAGLALAATERAVEPVRLAAPAAPASRGVDAATPSPWPAFVSGTSELVDRFGALGILFSRLREEKESLVGLGMVTVDRSIVREQPASVSRATSPTADVPPAVPVEVVVLNGNGHGSGDHNGAGALAHVEAMPSLATAADNETATRDQPRPSSADSEVATEIAQWRARLREGRNEAAEVVTTVERRLAATGQDPALLRVLGEAYLRLGRSDLAAAQFRAASARRVRRA